MGNLTPLYSFPLSFSNLAALENSTYSWGVSRLFGNRDKYNFYVAIKAFEEMTYLFSLGMAHHSGCKHCQW